MKAMINRGFMRGVAMLMSIVMAGSITGCSKEAGSTESVGVSGSQGFADTEVSGSQGFADAEVAGSQEVANSESDNSKEIGSNLDSSNDKGNDITDISSQTAALAAKIDDNGKPIADFYDYVNSDWLKEQEDKNTKLVHFTDEAYNRVKAQITDILSNTNTNDLSEDDGLYKAICFYDQMMQSSDTDDRIKTIRKHLSRIESIKTIEDLYALYKDPEYSLYNGILNFNVKPDDGGRNMLYLSWPNLNNDIQKNDLYPSYLSYLGYSEGEASRIISNATAIIQMKKEYMDAHANDGIYFYDQEYLDQCNVAVPAIEILKGLDSFGYHKGFLAPDDFCAFLNTVYKAENIETLRDYYLFNATYKLAAVSGSEAAATILGSDQNELAFSVSERLFADVINAEYNNRYLDEENIKLAESLTEDIKDILRDTLSEADWLSVHGKELAKHKMMIMRESFGGNQDENLLTDVKMSEDVVENFISLLISNQNHCRKQTKKEDDKRVLFDIDPFEINARYIHKYTILYVTSPMLCDPKCSNSVSYEERVAYLGQLIAHELSHTYDTQGIVYDYHGYYEPWMTEDEQAAYLDKIGKVTDFFGGKETDYGLKIDGKLVTNEAFADIMATKCSLKLLEKKENPDYDLYFRTLAKWNACFYTEDSLKEALLDTHLPAKERINYVLGQFDKFYETYDIDESSPYYIPESERLQAIF